MARRNMKEETQVEESQVEATEATETGEKKKRAPKTNLLDIVRGRMPALLVYIIRFKESSEAKNAELAKAYGTSVGKVFDIRKGRNFQYITKEWVPSQADIDNAHDWANNVEGHGGDYSRLYKEIKDFVAASEEEITARDAQVATLKPPRTRKAKEEAPAEAAAE